MMQRKAEKGGNETNKRRHIGNPRCLGSKKHASE